MSYALIESDLGDGRYRVRLDSGENQRKALISANELAMAQITFKMDVARDAVLVAEQQEAESRAAIQQLIDQLVVVQVSDPTLAELTKNLLNDAKLRYGRLVASHSPIRRQYETLKAAHAEGVKRRIRFSALETTSYRDAWCADYTTEAQGYVATIDIPGDSSLVLLAPGCRPWYGGDGTVSTERKTGNIVALEAQKAPLADEAGELTNTLIPQAVTLEATLVAERNAALAAVQAVSTQANRDALARATAALDAQRAALQQLRGREAVLQKQITRLDFQIATWNARPASDSPNYGDGRYRARELCSPEQAFFNAAIFPGWQKFKPTYRWGTITYLDPDNNLANVTLGPASSTASRLNTNQSPQLNGVPIRYMTCNAEAFEVGDNVVIGFGTMTEVEGEEGSTLAWSSSQRWEEPVIIGFLDTPRRCRPWPEAIYMDLWFETLVGPVGPSLLWTDACWRTGGCDGWERMQVDNLYTTEVAPTATHSFRLDAPVFSQEGDGVDDYQPYFTINVEGGTFGTTLWSDESSAYLWDVGGGRVPAGASCRSVSLVVPVDDSVYVQEVTCTAYLHSVVTDQGVVGSGDCSQFAPAVSGAWLVDGSLPGAAETVPFTATPIFDQPSAFEFLQAMGAAPTKISVTRGGQAASAKEYVLSDTGVFTETVVDQYTRTRWRMIYTKPE